MNNNSNNLSSCDYCNYCYSCDYCDSCNSCNSCNYCYYCNYCYSCDYSKGLRMSEKMIFCLGEGGYRQQGDGYQKNYHAFNKKVSKERYGKIFTECREILEDLKLELDEENWRDEWKKVTKKQWLKLSEIPEFDKEVVEGIIGFKLDLKEAEEMTVEQVCKELGREIKIVK